MRIAIVCLLVLTQAAAAQTYDIKGLSPAELNWLDRGMIAAQEQIATLRAKMQQQIADQEKARAIIPPARPTPQSQQETQP